MGVWEGGNKQTEVRRGCTKTADDSIKGEVEETLHEEGEGRDRRLYLSLNEEEEVEEMLHIKLVKRRYVMQWVTRETKKRNKMVEKEGADGRCRMRMLLVID